MRLRFGRCQLDSDSRQLLRDGARQPRSPKAFQFLELLLQERPRAVAKEHIHERLWPDSYVSDASLARLATESLADGDEICIGPAVLVFRTSAGNSTTETGTAA